MALSFKLQYFLSLCCCCVVHIVFSPLQSALSAVTSLSLQSISSLHLSELRSQQLQVGLRLLLAGPLRRHRCLKVPHTQLITDTIYLKLAI